ncbi:MULTISPECIES: sulfotransferase family protein [Actinoallomurus]|uniref:sulfotransferase family protein n=1 Tax=Actinoallomurus TaxID=667113 RepID=UPI00209260E9|nr:MULTISPECIES: sulfotransferase [Actinoallomurus]MCO5974293.1 sulfotransferase [Actinoallomurus soli]MCO5999307.1 sulfotransferase [Actinoallomurus rhizosphaericola]
MRTTSPHILVVNGTKVRRPVFVLGAPHSGTDLLARALRRSTGFHVTLGRPGVVRTVYAFARRPSIATERGQGAARVLRDAYAHTWQVTREGCGECPADCRELGRIGADGTCADPRGVQRFADATPDLIYSTDVILDAFPDAQLIQIIRDGRDVVAGMLTDERCLAWFRPGFANLDEVFPNPFFGVEDVTERARWPQAGVAVKCALRWRGSIRLSARLRAQTPEEQLFTIRYEELVARPREVVSALSDYLGQRVARTALYGIHDGGVGRWQEELTPKQVTQVEKIAGAELGRLGYRLSDRV